MDFQTTTSTDGTSISYAEVGEGPALLFVHGSTADHTRWLPFILELSGQYAIYLMDRRGRGMSGDTEPYHLMREAEDVAAVVEAIGEPVVLIGHSYGAVCSLEAALLTNKVSRLVLYEPPIPTGQPFYGANIPERIREFINQGELEAGLEHFFRYVVGMPDHELTAYRELPAWQVRISLAPTIARELILDQSWSLEEDKVRQLHVPTLLLLGGDSPVLFSRAIDALESILPNCERITLPGQQHIAMDTAPGLFAGEIERFLETTDYNRSVN